MLILLPPSEGKTAARRGASLRLDALSFEGLTEARETMLTATINAARSPAAQEIFKVSSGVLEEVRANVALPEVPAAPAWATYTGVLYDAFGYASLDAAAKRRAGRRVVLFSALFGALRLNDRIPAYRLSGSVSLPDVGAVSAYWAQRLGEVLDPVARGLIVDCRSSAYAAMWRAPDAVGVRVFRDVGGSRKVVTHMAKHSRGLVARALSERSDEPRTVAELASVLSDYFASTPVHTATGAPVAISIEHTDHTIDVITD
ncbi:peroxide stress protein YaaA [Epidermidibacterium keratini]|uniref:Peroxide stress protein YaaA n=1 Tax=Epidermidibacterium keratini TaxID=1891644 RepID=A0A7L4YPL7_9ACTN|nr:peroxide stress protein YaaA [Epidermidibacterium keratini]QHC01008.1 peroxide stress protein YaaA [Epidermidibacterium keratini]